MKGNALTMENRLLGEIGIAVDTRGDLFFDTLQSHNQFIDRFQYLPYRLYIYPYSSYSNIKEAIFMQLLDEDGRELVLQSMQKLAADMTQIGWQRNQLLLQNPFLPTTYWLWFMTVSRWVRFVDQLRYSHSKQIACYFLLHCMLKYFVTSLLMITVGFILIPIFLGWDLLNCKFSIWDILKSSGRYYRGISDQEKLWIQRFILDNNSTYNQLAFERHIERTMETLIQDMALNVIIMTSETSMKPLLKMKVKKRVENLRNWSCHCNTNNDIASFFGINPVTSSWSSYIKNYCDKNQTHFEDNLFEWLNSEFQLYVIQFYHNFESEDEMHRILLQMGVIDTPSPLMLSSASSLSSLSRHNTQSDDNENEEATKTEHHKQIIYNNSIHLLNTTESTEEKKSMDLEMGEIILQSKHYVYSPVNSSDKKDVNNQKHAKKFVHNHEITCDTNTASRIEKDKFTQRSSTEFLRTSGKSPLSILTSSPTKPLALPSQVNNSNKRNRHLQYHKLADDSIKDNEKQSSSKLFSKLLQHTSPNQNPFSDVTNL